MKFAVVLLALLPLVFSTSVEKRLINLGFGNVINIGFIRQKVQEILDRLGSDITEQRCEVACHDTFAVDENHLVHTVCTPVCRSFQNLVNLFGLRPHLNSAP
ncbi:hypothetical protein ACOMHN_008624 [Nucella lapillus]